MKELHKSLGWQYWQKTNFSAAGLGSLPEVRIEPAERFKTDPDAEQIPLPDLKAKGADLWETLGKRRSERRFTEKEAPDLQSVANLLWAAQGTTSFRGSIPLRAAPSAGALYPVETYVIASAVTDLSPGIYHLNAKEFCLQRQSGLDKATDLAGIAMGQRFVAQAPMLFAFTAIFRRNMHKYGHRGLRYILLDAGHICQNLLLAATGLGFKACPVAAFFDEPLNELLRIDGEEEAALYLTAVG
ncbi:MAG: SagB/ThcOx family dehydrogenase [Desulfonatronovibrionaceae bacterium]